MAKERPNLHQAPFNHGIPTRISEILISATTGCYKMYRKGCCNLVNNKGDKEFVSRSFYFMRFTCTLIEALTKIKRVGITAFIALLVAINDVAQVFAKRANLCIHKIGGHVIR